MAFVLNKYDFATQVKVREKEKTGRSSGVSEKGEEDRERARETEIERES